MKEHKLRKRFIALWIVFSIVLNVFYIYYGMREGALGILAEMMVAIALASVITILSFIWDN